MARWKMAETWSARENGNVVLAGDNLIDLWSFSLPPSLPPPLLFLHSSASPFGWPIRALCRFSLLSGAVPPLLAPHPPVTWRWRHPLIDIAVVPVAVSLLNPRSSAHIQAPSLGWFDHLPESFVDYVSVRFTALPHFRSAHSHQFNLSSLNFFKKFRWKRDPFGREDDRFSEMKFAYLLSPLPPLCVAGRICIGKSPVNKNWRMA